MSAGYHKARDTSSGAAGRREADKRADLRGDARGAEGVPGERDPRRRDLHGTREAQDGHLDGRRLRAQTAGTHPLRLRRLNAATESTSTVFSNQQVASPPPLLCLSAFPRLENMQRKSKSDFQIFIFFFNK